MVMVGLAPFEPINQVTPFTYRDNDTYLTLLHGLKAKVEELIVFINEVSETDAANLNSAVLALTAQFNSALAALRSDLEALIAGSHDESIAFDPTTGSLLSGLSTVISNVYDNLRVYAYFAKDYDDLDLTAAEYDALQYTARHYDLAVTYPTFNAEMSI